LRASRKAMAKQWGFVRAVKAEKASEKPPYTNGIR
jgi:hypothetical protein